MRNSTLAIGLIALGLLATPRAQEPQRVGNVTEGVTAVLVDVVVRDKRGQPVRDLTTADFEVLEDNVPHKVASFSVVSEGINGALAGAASAAPGATLPANATPPPGGSGGRAIGATGPAVTAL